MSYKSDLDIFIAAYVRCALWSSTGDDDQPLDDSYHPEDLSPEAGQRVVEDCRRFLDENRSDIGTQNSDISQAGHDFWLSRCGHGSGFLDGEWGEAPGDRLQAAAVAFGECNLYEGDASCLHLEGGRTADPPEPPPTPEPPPVRRHVVERRRIMVPPPGSF